MAFMYRLTLTCAHMILHFEPGSGPVEFLIGEDAVCDICPPAMGISYPTRQIARVELVPPELRFHGK